MRYTDKDQLATAVSKQQADKDFIEAQSQLMEAKERVKHLSHERSLQEGEFEYEVKISNVIYETRTVRADSEEEAQEKIQADLDSFNPHVEEDECDGATIEEVNEI
mgnify:FL=1|tara:strand:+ start:2231 stop:2548 length:318 start_codon:yes stop_codon:yes gene_type:complete